MTQSEYVDLIKSTFLDLGKKAVMSYIMTALPFLNVPILNTLVSFFVEKTLEILIKETDVAAFFFYIDLRTSDQGKEFEKAAIENHIAQQSGSEEEKKNAEKNLINSFRNLAKFSN